MEGKQEDRASPLDFPSAALADERRRRQAQERFEQNISPPTIPRSTNDIDTSSMFLGWQHTAQNPGAFQEFRSTTSNSTVSSSTNLRYGGRTSAFSTSRHGPFNNSFSGQIPAFQQQQYKQQGQGTSRNRNDFLPSSVAGYVPQENVNDQSSRQPSWMGSSDQQNYTFAPRQFVVSAGSDAQASPVGGRGPRFFTPLQATTGTVIPDHNLHTSSFEINELGEDSWRTRRSRTNLILCPPVTTTFAPVSPISPQSSGGYRPHSGASAASSLQTMGSIDEVEGTGMTTGIAPRLTSATSGDLLFAGSAPRISNLTPYQQRAAAGQQPRSRSSLGKGGGGESSKARSASSGRSLSRSEARSVSSGRSSRSRRRCTPCPASPVLSFYSEQKENGTDGKSPPPQNLRGDPFRSAKVKTELCRNFMKARGCPFGDKCNYAHGAHELKFTKLMDLERASLLDVEIFRTHPCPTWVATGSCPFDQRCIGLHDPRVEGKDPAWLPHAETMINKVADGINVDSFYHERVASAYNNCPIYGYVPLLGNRASRNVPDEASFIDFFDFICNSDRPNSRQDDIFDKIHENVQLQIVLQMRLEKTGSSYRYMPTHLLQGELCMVLQAKTFESRQKILDGFDSHEILTEIDNDSIHSHQHSRADNTLIIKAHEIAFGPVGDVTVRPVSVWFDLPNGDLVECTAQQAKHHKRSRHRLNKKVKKNSKIDENKSRIPPFNNYQPRDDAAFDLVTCILELRLNIVNRLVSRKGDFGHGNMQQHIIRELDSEMARIRHTYFSLLRHWVTWSWPDQMLEGIIDDETDVPPVDGEYYCSLDGMGRIPGATNEEHHGFGAQRETHNLTLLAKFLPCLVWKSFLVNIQLTGGEPIDMVRTNTKLDTDSFYFQLRRLSVFRRLSQGRKRSKDRNCPHILKFSSTALADIEGLSDKWSSTRDHYRDNIDNIVKRNLKKESDDTHADEESKAAKTMTKYLDTCAMQMTRTL